MPIASAANFAQFGACLAVAVKAHNRKTKAVALPSALVCLSGHHRTGDLWCQPALHETVHLRYDRRCLRGTLPERFSYRRQGVRCPGIPGLLAINHIGKYVILLAIAGGVAFALTMVVWKEEQEDERRDSGGGRRCGCSGKHRNAGGDFLQRRRTEGAGLRTGCSAGGYSDQTFAEEHF